jgi:hypothetical protein
VHYRFGRISGALVAQNLLYFGLGFGAERFAPWIFCDLYCIHFVGGAGLNDLANSCKGGCKKAEKQQEIARSRVG